MQFGSIPGPSRSPIILEPLKRALEGSLQLVGRAIDGVAQTRGLVRDGGGLATLDASFHHAALIVLAALVAVLAAEVDFYP